MVTVRGGNLLKIEFASLGISLPRFSRRFSLIPDSAILSLYKMSFKIDSRSMVLPPTEYVGGTRPKSDRRSSYES